MIYLIAGLISAFTSNVYNAFPFTHKYFPAVFIWFLNGTWCDVWSQWSINLHFFLWLRMFSMFSWIFVLHLFETMCHLIYLSMFGFLIYRFVRSLHLLGLYPLSDILQEKDFLTCAKLHLIFFLFLNNIL